MYGHFKLRLTQQFGSLHRQTIFNRPYAAAGREITDADRCTSHYRGKIAGFAVGYADLSLIDPADNREINHEIIVL